MIMYSGIFVCGWNFHFPTTIENIFWRIASGISVGFIIPGGIILSFIDYTYFGRGRYSRREPGWLEKRIDFLRKVAGFGNPPLTACIVDIEKGVSARPWDLYLPGPALAYCTVVCAIYCFARAYILVEDFIGIRRLPGSAFETVPWTRYLPQI